MKTVYLPFIVDLNKPFMLLLSYCAWMTQKALIMCTLEAAFTHFIPVGLNVELSKLKMYSDTWSQLFA